MRSPSVLDIVYGVYPGYWDRCRRTDWCAFGGSWGCTSYVAHYDGRGVLSYPVGAFGGSWGINAAYSRGVLGSTLGAFGGSWGIKAAYGRTRRTRRCTTSGLPLEPSRVQPPQRSRGRASSRPWFSVGSLYGTEP
jgi:hypothetical protein